MKIGKKISCGLLVCVLILILGTIAYAGEKVTITVGNVSGAMGQEVEVKIIGNNTSQMAGGQFELHYDSNIVEAKSLIAGNILDGKSFAKNLEQKGKAVFAWAGSSGGVANGEICTITFKLKKSGESKLEIAGVKLNDEESKPLAASLGNGKISVIGSGAEGGNSGVSEKKPSSNDQDSQVMKNFKNSLINKNGVEAIKQGQGAVKEAGYTLLNVNEIETLGDQSSAKISLAQVAEVTKKAALKGEELNQLLLDNGIKTSKKLEKIAVIEVPAQGTGAVSLSFPGIGLDELRKQGIDALELKTERATFIIRPDTFGNQGKDQDIVLTVKSVDRSSLGTASLSLIPDGKTLVDLTATIGGTAVTFANPIVVSIPYKALAGEKDEAITVFLLKDDGSVEGVGGSYDRENAQVKFLASHFSTYFAKPSLKSFSDLAKYSWAEQAVKTMGGKGIISGRTADKFDPGATITRAEFAALVSRMLMYEKDNSSQLPFKDVSKDKWYEQVVGAAYQHGLMKGKSADTFDPEGKITRQEMAVIIGNILEKDYYKPGEISQLSSFTDKEQISSWAEDSVALAVREGIVQGMEGGKFAPKENANRAQAAVMLYRLYGLIMN